MSHVYCIGYECPLQNEHVAKILTQRQSTIRDKYAYTHVDHIVHLQMVWIGLIMLPIIVVNVHDNLIHAYPRHTENS